MIQDDQPLLQPVEVGSESQRIETSPYQQIYEVTALTIASILDNHDLDDNC